MSQFITDDEKRMEALKLGTGAQFYSERGRSNSVPDVIKRAEAYYEFLAHKPEAKRHQYHRKALIQPQKVERACQKQAA